MQANAKLEAKRDMLLGREPQEMAPAEVLIEEVPKVAETDFAKVPSWVSTEDDLEEFLQSEKKKGTQIVRTGEKEQGSMPTETEMRLMQEEPAEEMSLLQKFPSWVQTEKSVEEEEAPVSLLEETATEHMSPAVKDRMQRLAKLNKRMATASANKLIEELNNY